MSSLQIKNVKSCMLFFKLILINWVEFTHSSQEPRWYRIFHELVVPIFTEVCKEVWISGSIPSDCAVLSVLMILVTQCTV